MKNDMTLTPDLLHQLGFHIIRGWLTERAHCEKTVSVLRELSPAAEPAEIQYRLNLTEDLVKAIERKDPVPARNFPDISPWLQQLFIEGTSLTPEQFRELKIILELSRLLRKVIKEKELNHWLSLSEKLFSFSAGEKEIVRIFDDEFQVKSSASSELASIRRKLKSIENAIHKRMQSLFVEAQSNKWLQDDRITWRDGRPVLPLSAGNKRKIPGIVHGRSATGQTVYVEPMEIVERNNDLQELRAEEKAEILKILRDLTDFFRPHVSSVTESFSTLVEFDIHYGYARLATILKGVRPELSRSGTVHVSEGRNPVLALSGKTVVPLNLHLSANDRILLLSGPNAGGKTVALKTIGLFSVMLQCGMFIPANNVKLPLYHRIMADIGDQQSMEDDLSTFSAHIRNLQTICKFADERSLLLLDELGTGTDPDAGSAISQAVLEHLKGRKSHVVATTHLGQLKLWAHGEEGIVNGGMRFDPDELAPTYELNVGQPGASYAIEISHRMGLAPSIIHRAKELLGNTSVKLEDLLNELEAERLKAAKLTAKLEGREAKLKTREQEMERLSKEIRDIRKRIKSEARQQAEKFVYNTRREMENLISRIRDSQADRDVIRKARGKLEKRIRDIRKTEERTADKIRPLLKASQVSKGMKVDVPHLNEKGTVLYPPDKKGKTTVEINGIKLTLDLAMLRPAEEPAEKPAESGIRGRYDVEQPESFQIDLRGKRVDEALQLLEHFLDNSLISGLHSVNILHGKGTGALQEAVHDYLKSQPYVDSFEFARPEAGGAGITIVHFK